MDGRVRPCFDFLSAGLAARKDGIGHGDLPAAGGHGATEKGKCGKRKDLGRISEHPGRRWFGLRANWARRGFMGIQAGVPALLKGDCLALCWAKWIPYEQKLKGFRRFWTKAQGSGASTWFCMWVILSKRDLDVKEYFRRGSLLGASPIGRNRSKDRPLQLADPRSASSVSSPAEVEDIGLA
jgi:hypothetical protein